MILLEIKHNTLHHNYHESILTQDRRLTIESISLTVPSHQPAEDTGLDRTGQDRTCSNNAIMMVLTDSDPGSLMWKIVSAQY